MKMAFQKLKRKVPAIGNQSNGDETKGLFPNKAPRVKIMTMLKATEKIKRESKKAAFESRLLVTLENRVSSLIRILIEATNQKVSFVSPAALRFLGPGDHHTNPFKKGGIKKTCPLRRDKPILASTYN